MRSTLRVRATRLLASAGLIAALLLPAGAPVTAAGEDVLRVGTTQDLDSMNPWQTVLVTGYEAFTLNYDLLVNIGSNLEPIPGFAASWTQSEDGLTWTFKIRDGMLWSDGQPATAEDARWTIQFVLDGINSEAGFVGLGYLDPYIAQAGVQTVEAPDATTLVITTDRPNDQILRSLVPMLPKHIWEGVTVDTVADFQNETPVVGSGPYQAVEWQTGQFIRFQRNANYWKDAGAASEVILQIFSGSDTMVQALRTGQLDYAHQVNPDQFVALGSEPNIVAVEGGANGFTEFGFNTYGTGTGNTIPGGGPASKALLDPAFRDAVGYAIDKELLVDRVLGGFGTVGTTQVPPFQAQYHVEPTKLRTFDLELAKSKLEAAGYVLDANGARLDKEGKALNLRLFMPDSESTYPGAAQFIQDWLGELGIGVTTEVFDSQTLTDIMLPPEAGDYTADYDLFIWGWGGDIDPDSLLKIFTCDQIGSSSDSQYCNPAYDELYAKQNVATSLDERKALLAEMQNIFYDEAPYHILFYDSVLAAYRTDRFTGWTNQPETDGAPLFGQGSIGYTLLKLAGGAAASPAPSEGAAVPATPAPSASGAAGSVASNNVPILIGGIALAIVAVIVVLMLRRRRTGAAEDE